MPSPFVIPRVLHLADASDAGVAQGGGQEKKGKGDLIEKMEQWGGDTRMEPPPDAQGCKQRTRR
jgi:hypothetical protein